MSNTREIKNHILSVNNTSKITRAMQMVSASKMKKAQERAQAAVPYAEGLYEIVKQIGYVSEYRHPLMRKVEKVNNIYVLVIAPDRGFVGGLITQLLINTNKLVESLKNKYQGVNIYGVSIHRKGAKILSALKLENKYFFSDYYDQPTTTELTPIIQVLEDGFVNENYDQLYIIYPHFINTIVQEVVSKRLLPLSFDELIDEKSKNQQNSSYSFEPSVEEVLNKLIPEYFENQIYAAVLDTIASEHSARMVAMKNATDNAKEMEKSLKIEFNKSRQTTITKELIEIISGSMN